MTEIENDKSRVFKTTAQVTPSICTFDYIPSTRLGVIWLRSFSLKSNIQLMSIVEGLKLNFINFPAFQFQLKTK